MENVVALGSCLFLLLFHIFLDFFYSFAQVIAVAVSTRNDAYLLVSGKGTAARDEGHIRAGAAIVVQETLR